MNYKKITNLEELNKALDNEENNFVIANGALRSSKWITYGEDEGTYEVFHLIDDSTETITASELFAESNIGRAMRNGCFFCETDEAKISLSIGDRFQNTETKEIFKIVGFREELANVEHEGCVFYKYSAIPFSFLRNEKMYQKID